MTRFVRFSLALGCAVALSGLALAQTPNLDLKVGLWEMTMNIDMGAAPPGMDTSKMTPEQQAQIAAMMRGRGAGGGMPATTIKNCLTKEKLAEHKYHVRIGRERRARRRSPRRRRPPWTWS